MGKYREYLILKKTSRFSQHLIIFDYTLSRVHENIFSNQYRYIYLSIAWYTVSRTYDLFKNFLKPEYFLGNAEWEKLCHNCSRILLFYFNSFWVKKKKNGSGCLKFHMSALERLFNSGPGGGQFASQAAPAASWNADLKRTPEQEAVWLLILLTIY